MLNYQVFHLRPPVSALKSRFFWQFSFSKNENTDVKIRLYRLYKQIYDKKYIQCVTVVSGLGQKCAFTKKSTIFTRSLQNFVKMWSSWVPSFVKISSLLDENCGFKIRAYFQTCAIFCWQGLIWSVPRLHFWMFCNL